MGRHGPYGPWGGHGRGGGWGGFWRDFGGGRPPRAERGEVRYLVLDAVSDEPRHGYEIMQKIEERSGGAYRPSPGVVYPTLQLLDEMGLVRALDRDGRKVYEITDEGRKELEQHRDEVSDFYERSGAEFGEVDFVEVATVMRGIAGLLRSLRRAARRGHLPPGVVNEIAAIVEDAGKKIEAVLDRSDRRR